MSTVVIDKHQAQQVCDTAKMILEGSSNPLALSLAEKVTQLLERPLSPIKQA